MTNLLGLQMMAIDSFISLKWPLQHHIYTRRAVVKGLIIATWVITAAVIFYYPILLAIQIHRIESVMNEHFSDSSYRFCRSWYIFYTLRSTPVLSPLQSELKAARTFNSWKFNVLFIIALFWLILIYIYRAHVVRRWTRRQSQNLPSTKRLGQMRKVQVKSYKRTVLLIGSFLALWSTCIVIQVLHAIQNFTDLRFEDRLFHLPDRICVAVCGLTTILDVIIYMILMKEKEVERLHCHSMKVISCCFVSKLVSDKGREKRSERQAMAGKGPDIKAPVTINK